MSVLNYFFIGFAFAFIVDILLNLKPYREAKIDLKWNWAQRLSAILIWPIGVIIFLVAFFKAFFKWKKN